MWKNYLALPCIAIDGTIEHSEGEPLEYVIVGTEVPYWDTIVMISDSWRPNTYKEAFSGVFDTTEVLFASGLKLEVVWNKKKFKEKWAKFVEEREAEDPNFKIEFTTTD